MSRPRPVQSGRAGSGAAQPGETPKNEQAEKEDPGPVGGQREGGNSISREGQNEGSNSISRDGQREGGNSISRDGQKEGGNSISRDGQREGTNSLPRDGQNRASDADEMYIRQISTIKAEDVESIQASLHEEELPDIRIQNASYADIGGGNSNNNNSGGNGSNNSGGNGSNSNNNNGVNSNGPNVVIDVTEETEELGEVRYSTPVEVRRSRPVDIYFVSLNNIRINNEDALLEIERNNQRVLMEEEAENRPFYAPPEFFSKLFRYQIKIDCREGRSSRSCGKVVFLIFLFLLFFLETYLLYGSFRRMEVDRTYVLMESKFNQPFTTGFLHQFDGESLENSIVTPETIQREVSRGNFHMHGRICWVLRSFNYVCPDEIDIHTVNGKPDPDRAYVERATLNAFELLTFRDLVMYQVGEQSVKCEHLSKLHYKNYSGYIYLFSKKDKNMTLSLLFVILNGLFLSLRLAMMLSRILYDVFVSFFYAGFRLTLRTKRNYLLRYIVSVCSVIFLEAVVGPDCVAWWIDDLSPRRVYNFQYVIWALHLACYLTFLISRAIRAIKRRDAADDAGASHINLRMISNANYGARDGAQAEQPVEESTRSRYKYGFLEHFFNIIHNVLFYFLMFISILVLLSIYKPAVIVTLLTIALLLIDVFNSTYLQEFVYHTRIDEPVERGRKQLFAIENKNRSRPNFSKLLRVNEHSYRHLTLEELQRAKEQGPPGQHSKENLISDNKSVVDVEKQPKAKSKWFKRSVFNHRHLDSDDIKNRLSHDNPYEHCATDIVAEFCEICDDKYRNVVLYPCMHGGFCEVCVRSLVSTSMKVKMDIPKCPFCREEIKRVYKIIHIYECDLSSEAKETGETAKPSQVADVFKIMTIIME